MSIVKNVAVFASLVFCAASAAQSESGENSASRFFARSSSPDAVASSVAAAVAEDPSLAPSVVVDAVDNFAAFLSGEELENAVSLLFAALSASSPESLIKSVSAVVEKYPNLAIVVAEASLRGSPTLAREVSEAVMLAAPETDVNKLSSVVSSASGQEISVVEGWLVGPDSWVGLPSSGFPGAAGGSRPQPYSE